MHHVRWREVPPELCRSRAAHPGLGLHLQQEGRTTGSQRSEVRVTGPSGPNPSNCALLSGGAAAQPRLSDSGVHQRQEQEVRVPSIKYSDVINTSL